MNKTSTIKNINNNQAYAFYNGEFQKKLKNISIFSYNLDPIDKKTCKF